MCDTVIDVSHTSPLAFASTTTYCRDVTASSSLVPFGDRLRELLAKRGKGASQAWLSKRSGVDRSLLSRLIGNDRLPTIETLQALAPALEVDLVNLVAGTDAQARLTDSTTDRVRRSDYTEAIGKIIEYESKLHAVEARARSLGELLDKEQTARRLADSRRAEAEVARDESLTKRAEAEARCEAHEKELMRYKIALQRALAQFSALKVRVDELMKELGETKQSSAVSAMLSGVAAVASMATIAYFLGEDSPHSSPTRKRTS